MTDMNMRSTKYVSTGSRIRSSRDVSTGSHIKSTRTNVVKVDKSVSTSVVMPDVSFTTNIDDIKQTDDLLDNGIDQGKIVR